ncbi:hypothetical protein HPB51_019742 [Rhipicephalus microplus]|uniref:Uncharacterized protein n=1 Tax=Rhipicephalus microplus TaxID=6941 RepID=A0A9J6F5Z1_RHIMP|nr:hypothetical protein HPB51_019742 [Rhipicephalus microplus]
MKKKKLDAMEVNMVAVVVLAAYFGVLVGLSAWSSRRGTKRAAKLEHLRYGSPYDESLSPGFIRLMLANRSVPLCLGVTSMTVTWVGGGFFSGTAEAVYVHGLLSTQVPIGYTISLIFGGLFFSHKMRATRSLTMLDPFQQLYGRWIGPLLCLPALAGELFWSASVYAALGQAAEVVAGLSGSMVIVLSSLIVALCTCLGGLPAVVSTDAFHFFAAFVGLWVCVPFCMTTKFANNEVAMADASSEAALHSIPEMVDRLFSLVYGGLPWQVYFQRVLSSSTVFDAQMMSYVSAVGCLMFAVPPILIGSTSKRANFTAAGYPGPARLLPQDQARVLPLAIRYLCPGLVSMMGMVAIVGAVMSSADSSALSASTLVARNVYQRLFKPTARERELVKVLRLAVCAATAAAMTMALSVSSVFTLWMVSSEMVYVLLFPQLIGVFYMPKWTNSYGSVASFVLGSCVRILCGEPTLGIPAVLRLPFYDKESGQRFPFRTFCTLVSIASLVLVSMLAKAAFSRGWLRQSLDVCKCFQDDVGTRPGAPSPGVRLTRVSLDGDSTANVVPPSFAGSVSVAGSSTSSGASPAKPPVKRRVSIADFGISSGGPLISKPGAPENTVSTATSTPGIVDNFAPRSSAALSKVPTTYSSARRWSATGPKTLVGFPRVQESSDVVASSGAPPETTGTHETGGAAFQDKTSGAVPSSPPYRSPVAVTAFSTPTEVSAMGTEMFSLFTVSPSTTSTPLAIGAMSASSVDGLDSLKQSSEKAKDLTQARTTVAGTLTEDVASEPTVSTSTASGTTSAAAIQEDEAVHAAAAIRSSTGWAETTPLQTTRCGLSAEDTKLPAAEAADGKPSSSAVISKTAENVSAPTAKPELREELSSLSAAQFRSTTKKTRSKKALKNEKTKQDRPSRRQ